VIQAITGTVTKHVARAFQALPEDIKTGCSRRQIDGKGKKNMDRTSQNPCANYYVSSRKGHHQRFQNEMRSRPLSDDGSRLFASRRT